MSQTEERVTAFGPEVVTLLSDSVQDLMALSKKKYWGAYLVTAGEVEGLDWYPKEMFPGTIHKEALRRLEEVQKELPYLQFRVLIGDEPTEPKPTWGDKAQEAQNKVVAGGKQAAPIVVKALVATVAVGALCILGAAAFVAVTATAVVAAPVMGLVALDPKMVLDVDGYWICICSWTKP